MGRHERVLDEALKLPLDERVKLVSRLLETLEGDERDPDWARAWTEEIARRIADHDAGLVTAIPADRALAIVESDDV